MTQRRLGIVDLDKYDLPNELAERMLSHGDRVISEKQRESFKDKVDSTPEYEGKFVNSVDDKVKELSEELTLSQLGLFASLIPFMDFKTKNLIWNGKQMTQTDIIMALGVSPHSVPKQLKELEEIGFVYRDKKGKGAIYKLNEDVLFIGKHLKDEYTTKIFTVRFRELTQGLKLNEIGLFYRLIPYLNTKYYVLSYNPYELDTEEVKPLTTYQSIADSVGMDRGGIQRLMGRLIRNNLIFSIEGSKRVFIFNPEIVTRNVKKDSLEKVIEIVKNRF